MTERRLELALAVVFLIVGILATANTFRLNSYIHDTLPRDLRQEQCNTDTITVLKQWVQARADRDAAADTRDDALIVIVDKRLAEVQPTPHELQVWRDSITAAQQAREDGREKLVPLPTC